MFKLLTRKKLSKSVYKYIVCKYVYDLKASFAYFLSYLKIINIDVPKFSSDFLAVFNDKANSLLVIVVNLLKSFEVESDVFKEFF